MFSSVFDIAVAGAGASGLMAAVCAAREYPAAKIVALEKGGEPALKLYATGNGRCNYLNRTVLPSSYYSAEDPDSLSAAARAQIYEGAAEDLIRLFKSMSIEPFEEEDGRLYPRSRQASSVVTALVSEAARLGVRTICGFELRSAVKTDEGFVLTSADGRRLLSSSLILACGGKAGIQYGCTGDGYRIASSFGLKVVKPFPALTKLVCAEDMSALAGVRAPGRISLVDCGGGASTVAGEDSGEIQFTADGLSGICTFNISRFYRIYEGCSYRAELDLLEEYSEVRLREMLLERRVRSSKEPCGMLFLGLLPSKLGTYILGRCGVSSERVCGELSIDLIEKLAVLCKELSFTVTGARGWKDAQVTAGGVSLEEVDPFTLEAKKVPGLFLCGEILDIDGPCGGYNLTWAFASGRSAGAAAAGRVKA